MALTGALDDTIRNMKRLILFLLCAGTLCADTTFDAPVTFAFGSNPVRMNNGLLNLYGTWDFTNATVIGIGGGSTCITCSGTDGQVAIWNAGLSQFVAGDPIVSGPDAPGTPPTKNPVQVGFFDGTNIRRASSDSSGNLNVNVQNSPAVTGTVTANQGGTWTVQPGNTANTTAWKVDGSGVTQPVSGTVTANQGGSWTVTANAGTNLNTSSLALDSTVAKLNLSQASTTSGQTGPLVQGAVTTSAPTYTTAQTDPLSLTTAGALRTDGSGVTQPVSGTVTANAGSGTFTVSGTVTANAGTNLNTSALALESGGNLATIMTNLSLGQGSTTSGQKANLILGAVTTSAPTYTTAQSDPLSLNTAGGLRVDGSGVTQPVSGTVTANAGSGTMGVNIAQVSASSVATAGLGSGVQKVGIVGNANVALDVATGAAVPANGFMTSARAATANPSNATGGNLVGVMADKAGRLVTTTNQVRDLVAVQQTAISASAAETTIVTAGAAGVFNDLTELVITNSGSATCNWTLRDSTAGTIRGIYDMPATVGTGSLVIQFNPPLPQATAANNWTIQCSTATSTGAHIQAVFIKNT